MPGHGLPVLPQHADAVGFDHQAFADALSTPVDLALLGPGRPDLTTATEELLRRLPDIELAGLFASCMAYGRVDLFGAWVTWVLDRMGESPARFVWGFDLEKHRRVFTGFRYRFNREPDVLAFCLAAWWIGVVYAAVLLPVFTPAGLDFMRSRPRAIRVIDEEFQ